ncbi:MAG: HD domain-containing protein [Oscillospiraceae bacterium]|jgi:putative nucleotidyltransferase with HDIG domain|nr:HD domain-containing protein [Oscillospiraceae bacterium]
MEISRHSLIFGLSYALDIMGKNNLSHSKSTAYLSVKTASEMGLDEDETLIIYYAALLHDIGLSNEYVLGQTDAFHLRRHCERGEELLSKLPLPGEIPRYVRYHHEYRDGSGSFGVTGGDVPLGSQIICLASDFDDNFGKTGVFDRDLSLKISAWLDKGGELFPQEIVGAFGRLAAREYFLLDYFNHETKYMLSDKVSVNDGVCYGGGDITKFALCFADIIDQRSPFTFTHSHGIAELAVKAAEYLGYGGETAEKMYMAGLLHDIGKLYVPTDILHKNGKLTPEERFEINKHTYYTRKILEQIQGFEGIVDIAANHHEKLDGTGYPYHLKGERLSELERMMAICDVYQALTEERPYREKLPPEKVWGIIGDMCENRHLDKQLAEKAKRVFV